MEVYAGVDKGTGRLAGGERVDEGAVGAAAAFDLVDEGLEEIVQCAGAHAGELDDSFVHKKVVPSNEAWADR